MLCLDDPTIPYKKSLTQNALEVSMSSAIKVKIFRVFGNFWHIWNIFDITFEPETLETW